MGLLKVGVNNKILHWRAKTHQVDIHVNDTSGLTQTLDEMSAYFYAKKYPIQEGDGYAISKQYSNYDADKGIITFDLDILSSDISAGDYVYEVAVGNDEYKVSVVQDKLTFVESLYSNTYPAPPDACIFWSFDNDVSDHISTYDLSINGIRDYSFETGRIAGYKDVSLNNVPGWDKPFNDFIVFESAAAGSNICGGVKPFSLAIWFKTDVVSSGRAAPCLFSAHGFGQNGFDIHLDSDTKLIIRRFIWGGGNEWSYTSPVGYNDNEWHNIVYTFDGFTDTIYLDGDKVFQTSGNWNSNGTTVILGAEYLRSTLGGLVRHPYPGKLDDVKIWDQALSHFDVLSYYHTQKYQYLP